MAVRLTISATTLASLGIQLMLTRYVVTAARTRVCSLDVIKAVAGLDHTVRSPVHTYPQPLTRAHRLQCFGSLPSATRAAVRPGPLDEGMARAWSLQEGALALLTGVSSSAVAPVRIIAHTYRTDCKNRRLIQTLKGK